MVQTQADREIAWLNFNLENPEVFDELVELAREARASGLKKVGMSLLFGHLRWLKTKTNINSDDKFLINNNHAPFFARAIMAMYPNEFGGFFEIRKPVVRKKKLTEDEIIDQEAELWMAQVKVDIRLAL